MRMALFSRRPRLRPKFPAPKLIPADRAERYPALAADLAAIAEVVGPAFSEHDHNALVAQNNYWRQQVTLIIVTGLTTAFGAVAAAYRHQVWPGVVVAVFGVLSAAVAGLGRSAPRSARFWISAPGLSGSAAWPSRTWLNCLHSRVPTGAPNWRAR
jgi:hypothetical protein